MAMDPNQRPSAEGALHYRYLQDVAPLHDYSKVTLERASHEFFDFELEKNDLATLKTMIAAEVLTSCATVPLPCRQPSGEGGSRNTALTTPIEGERSNGPLSQMKTVVRSSLEHQNPYAAAGRSAKPAMEKEVKPSASSTSSGVAKEPRRASRPSLEQEERRRGSGGGDATSTAAPQVYRRRLSHEIAPPLHESSASSSTTRRRRPSYENAQLKDDVRVLERALTEKLSLQSGNASNASTYRSSQSAAAQVGDRLSLNGSKNLEKPASASASSTASSSSGYGSLILYKKKAARMLPSLLRR